MSTLGITRSHFKLRPHLPRSTILNHIAPDVNLDDTLVMSAIYVLLANRYGIAYLEET
jgi:hypothetical protein